MPIALGDKISTNVMQMGKASICCVVSCTCSRIHSLRLCVCYGATLKELFDTVSSRDVFREILVCTAVCIGFSLFDMFTVNICHLIVMTWH